MLSILIKQWLFRLGTTIVLFVHADGVTQVNPLVIYA